MNPFKSYVRECSKEINIANTTKADVSDTLFAIIP